MTKTKICGINSHEALTAAIASGADYIGLVFYPKSPRNVDLAAAVKLARAARQSATAVPQVVALLVDPDDQRVDGVLNDVAPDVLQLHGHETHERVAELKKRAGKTVWKAVGVATQDDVKAALTYRDTGTADAILFDAKPPPESGWLPGGNGLTFDWTILDRQSRNHQYILAGGLTSKNVINAIKLLSPAIVDVSSGVERVPGVKDATLIHDFISAARSVKQTT